ncbi:hypothetical protein T484DRAFT_1747604 [Baffinella frigidus]|nr:hypothetical protein T484DRAFT_1747604 [Cryptophyta sp. CCMP2293]
MSMEPTGPPAVQYGPRDLFDIKARSVYNKWVALSTNPDTPKEKRRYTRGLIARKLNVAVAAMSMEPPVSAVIQYGPPDIFDIKARSVYNKLVALSTNPDTPKEKRKMHKGNAVWKMKTAVAAFREAEELAVLRVEQRTQALMVPVFRSYDVMMVEADLPLVEHDPLDIFDFKQRGIYNEWFAVAANTAIPKEKRSSARDGAAKKLKICIAVFLETERLNAMSPEQRAETKRITAVDRKAYLNSPEVLVKRGPKQESNRKHREKERNMCLNGDLDALARREHRNESERKRTAEVQKRSSAAITAWYKEHGLIATTFGEARDDEIADMTSKIFASPVGTLCKVPATDSWENDHGKITLYELLMRRGHQVYILTTMTKLLPNRELECRETYDWCIKKKRDPLTRVKDKDGDLKLFTMPQVKSIVQPYILAQFGSAYDSTSVESSCQHFLEDELKLPHGIILHKKAGAGNRLKNTLSKDEIRRIKRGDTIVYSVAIAIVKITDHVFVEEPNSDADPTGRGPSLLSACVHTHDGSGVTYNVSIRENGTSFPDTPSVLADKAAIDRGKAAKNERHRKRKADAIET